MSREGKGRNQQACTSCTCWRDGWVLAEPLGKSPHVAVCLPASSGSVSTFLAVATWVVFLLQPWPWDLVKRSQMGREGR